MISFGLNFEDVGLVLSEFRLDWLDFLSELMKNVFKFLDFGRFLFDLWACVHIYSIELIWFDVELFW